MIRERELETQNKKYSDSYIDGKVGNIAAYYLSKLSDNKFEMYHNHDTKMHMIGKNQIFIKENVIILNNRVYKGTQG